MDNINKCNLNAKEWWDKLDLALSRTKGNSIKEVIKSISENIEKEFGNSENKDKNIV